MQAAIYTRTGPAREVLNVTEVATPAAGPGEVRIRLSWSGVNPSDVKTRAGVRNSTLPFPRIIPHSDGAGVIDQVGEGVDAGRIGQRVWTWNAAWGRADGTAAQYITLPAAQAVALPDGIPGEVGACLGIPALTAWQAVYVDGGVAGKRVLVAGGAGAVGNYAVQMAKRAGAALVIATVSSAEKAALARDAGADVVLNYRTEDLVAAVLAATDGAGVDRIIEVDFGANVGQDIAMLKPEGELVVYGSNSPEIGVPFVPSILKNIRMRFFIVYNLSPADRAAALAGLTGLLEENALMHNIAARLPLARIAEAHELVESGKAVGNVVLSIE
ncbi:NADPH:quinone reductase [Noviherbaspirillum sp.]|uniref:NADPH:quinone reductase n=1 Tax=Noviherbaspirillum sp. TaxID=1926288 RepID=UPI002D6F4F72|nr:NADPH:quinone reductase [Noviherbaspirillum sp.]HZW23535.1 NADPH:quinone reductase [Noviherbaspirillum sp.]